jgi:DNA-binding IclR family transcriptional regulator
MLVKSADRVLDILEALSNARGGFTLSALARELRIPKSSAWNLLNTLISRRYVDQTAEGRFVLGARMFELGAQGSAIARLRDIARPIMVDLARRSGETVFLGVLTPDFAVLQIEKVVSTNIIRYDAEIGLLRPAHCTSMGKVLLASLPRGELERFLERAPFKRFTPKTLTGADELRSALAEVRDAGAAHNVEEMVADASAIAAPVRSASSETIAGLLVGGPTSRILQDVEGLTRMVQEAAGQIGDAHSADLGPRQLEAPAARIRGRAKRDAALSAGLSDIR